MSFSTEVLLRAKARLASMREDHASLNAARQAQVYRKVPRIQAIDKQMQQNMLKAAISAFSEGGENAMALAKLQNQQLQSERDVLMAENQYLPEGMLLNTPAPTPAMIAPPQAGPSSTFMHTSSAL